MRLKMMIAFFKNLFDGDTKEEDGKGEGSKPRQNVIVTEDNLDLNVQETLSLLYPPFRETAPIIIGQVCQIVEKDFKGDGFSFLTDFLLVAKPLLQCLREEAKICLVWKGQNVPIVPEGWPLCYNNKILVHLRDLDPKHLELGDFYFLVTSVAPRTIRLLLKYYHDGSVLHQTIPEENFESLFTPDFIDNIATTIDEGKLQFCILSGGSGIERVTWDEVICPRSLGSEALLNGARGGERQGQDCCVLKRSHSASSLLNESHAFSDMGSELDESSASVAGDEASFVERQIASKRASLICMLPISHTKMHSLSDSCLTRTSSNSSLTSSTAGATVRSSQHMSKCQSQFHLGSAEKSGVKYRYTERSIVTQESGSNPESMAVSTSDINTLLPNTYSDVDPTPLYTPPVGAQYAETINNTSTCGGIETARPVENATLETESYCNTPPSSTTSELQQQQSDTESEIAEKTKSPFQSQCSEPHTTYAMPSYYTEDYQGHAEISRHNSFDSSSASSDSRRKESHPYRPKQSLEVNFELLHAGVARIPGSRDTTNRAVIELNAGSLVLNYPGINSQELAKLLMYYYNIPREETSKLGLTFAVDFRHPQTSSSLAVVAEALCNLEENIAGSVYFIYLVGDITAEVYRSIQCFSEPEYRFQVELLPSVDALFGMISSDQLTSELGGSFPYSHEEWIRFRMKLEPFVSGCRSAVRFIGKVTLQLANEHIPTSAREISLMLEHHEQKMKSVYEDTRLVGLQKEGDTILSRLQSDTKLKASPDFCEAGALVTKLYNEVHEHMIKLDNTSKDTLARIEEAYQLRQFEEEFHKVSVWITRKGEAFLSKQDLGDSLTSVKAAEKEFEKFYFTAMKYCEKADDLIEEANTLAQSTHVDSLGLKDQAKSLRQHLSQFQKSLEIRRNELEHTLQLHHHLDRAYEWALNGMRYLAKMNMEKIHCEDGCSKLIRGLQRFLRKHPPITNETFARMNDLALKLSLERCQQQCHFAQARCHETEQLFDKRMQSLKKACENFTPVLNLSKSGEFTTSRSNQSLSPENADRSRISTPSPVPPRESADDTIMEELDKNYHRDADTISLQTQGEEDEQIVPGAVESDPECGRCGPRDDVSPAVSETRSAPEFPPRTPDDEFTPTAGAGASPAPFQTEKQLKRFGKLKKRAISIGSIKPLRQTTTIGVPEVIVQHDLNRERSKSMIQNTQRRFSSDETCNNVGRHADLLELARDSKTETEHQHRRPVVKKAHTVNVIIEDEHVSTHTHVQVKGRLKHIMDEMIQTERDYARSLFYIIDNYVPEIQRMDVPQGLRGKRNVVFTNLEKIYNFHAHYFLIELEQCAYNPLLVGASFLHYERDFYLYALYNKNKPKSDALMADYGNDFFKSKQIQLNDRMDLASYLLKPVQRMAKYALLLQDILKCCEDNDPNYPQLKAAIDMVKFQLRHGNDLLALDSLKDCDLDLTEAGTLLLQDEFLVWQGRKKFMRHLFLFEELIIFSKTKKSRNGHDAYAYKHSLKMHDIGLTQTIGDSGYKFEIWFRRYKPGESYVLQAPHSDACKHWVSEVTRLLWQQALRNRERRLCEMSSMGVGSKPHQEIQPNDNQINDRAVNYFRGRGSKARNSIAVSATENQTFKRPHSVISMSSTSSSSISSQSSVVGGLFLANYDPFQMSSTPQHPSQSYPYEVESCPSATPILVPRGQVNLSNNYVGNCSESVSHHSSSSSNQEADMRHQAILVEIKELELDGPTY